MAGRVTHLQDWAEKEGGWEPPVTLKNGARLGLEAALGRKLNPDEVAAIERDIAPIRHLKTGFPNATAQDVKRTLGNIGKLPPSEALAAYRKIDSGTACRIDEAMCVNLGLNPDSLEWRQPSGENVAKAAAAALENLRKTPVGRPNIQARREWLAIYSLSLWARLGGGEMKIHSWETDTPLVNFMMHLASIVEDIPLNNRNAAKLLTKAAIERAKMTR